MKLTFLHIHPHIGMGNPFSQPESPIQDCNELTSNDLALLVNTLSPVASKCASFGLQVGLQYSQLRAIEYDHKRCEDQLREILAVRLKERPPLTWRDIISALEAPAMMENRLARQIEAQFVNTDLPRLQHDATATSAPTHTSDYYNGRAWQSQMPVLDLVSQHQSPLNPQPLQVSSTGYKPLTTDFQLSDQLSWSSQRDFSFPSTPLFPPSHESPSNLTVRPTPARKPTTQLKLTSPPYFAHLGEQSSSTEVKSPMDQFVDYVKTIYKSSAVERNVQAVKWPPTPSKTFINVACIDRKGACLANDYDEITEAMIRDGNVDVIRCKKCLIDFDQIARGLSATTSERVILVEGAPGVGKSTFAWEFCRRWERGEISRKYELVLLLRLRDERISKARNLKGLLYHSSRRVSQAVKAELESTLGTNTLIILEGYDELPDACRTAPSVFVELIYGQLLPLATVMVTSRPWATQGLHVDCSHRILQHIEILGFSEQQISTYIRSILSESEFRGFHSYIEKYPQIRMCMYIPLNSAIVVTVYRESKVSKCALPTTLTELYTALTKTLLLRYLRSHPEYGTIIRPIQTLSDFPRSVYDKFCKLCHLAYAGISGAGDHVQLIFNNLPSDFDNLGLMDSVTELYATQGTVLSHNFLHLTFQEFFAAFHVSTLAPAEQLMHFKSYRKEGRFKVVLKFLAGLTKLAHVDPPTFVDLLQSEDFQSYSSTDFIFLEHVNWVYEAQKGDLMYCTFDEEKSIDFKGWCTSRMDYYSLGYCIAHSRCQWVLTVLSEDEAKLLVAGLHNKQNPGGRVVELNGGFLDHFGDAGLNLSTECITMLFTELKSVLRLRALLLCLSAPCSNITWPDLSRLRRLDLEFSGRKNWRLDCLLHHLPLEDLTIKTAHDTNILFEDCVAIANLVKSAVCLRSLHLSALFAEIIVDDKGMEVICAALASNPALPLEFLYLDCTCTLSDFAVDCLAQLFANTTTLKSLKTGKFTFTVRGLLQLAWSLRYNSTLYNNIQHSYKFNGLTCTINDDEEASELAQFLVLYPDMTMSIETSTLVKICDAGVVALAGGLHDNTMLRSLDFSRNRSIGEEGTRHLVHALTVCSYITTEFEYGGLTLPKRCKRYAMQCSDYESVKDRIRFL